MDEKELITNICLYLEILVSENEPGSEWQPLTREEAFLCSLDRNTLIVLREASKHEHIRKILNCYVSHPSVYSVKGERYWNFTILCLTLLKGLNEALLSQQHNESVGSTSEVSSLPKVALSIKQRNTVTKCLQYVIALGILPNIIPGVKQALRKKTEAYTAVENIDPHSSIQEKYYRLLTCLLVLLECLNEDSLQAIVTTHYAADLLAVLLQICYAPIKKVNGVKGISQSEQSDIISSLPIASAAAKIASHQKYQDFNWIMSKLRGCCDLTDEEFIREMWEDRKYFIICLENFITQLSSSSLMFQLLLLQGTSSDVTKDTTHQQTKIPPWFRRVCNQMLTDKFLEPEGIRTFIQVAFDRMTDVDIKTGRVSREKIEAVSRVISHNSIKHMPLEMYMEEVIAQVLKLIHLNSSNMCQIFASVASSIVLQFAERNFELTERYVLNYLFKPFIYCLQSNDNSLLLNGETVVREENITLCIEDTYKIFVYNRSVLTHEAVKLLLPFYHLLFVMYMKFLRGISFLKSKVQGLLLAILDNHSREDSLKLLHFAAFEDVRIPDLRLVSNLKCVFGDTGGIEVIKNVAKNDEDLAEDIESKCQAINELLNGLSDKKIKSLFFLSLLRKSTHLEKKDIPDYIEKDEVSQFIDNLILIQLVEDLGENIGDELISDIDEAIELIEAALECGVGENIKKDGPSFSDDTMISFLIILSTLIGYKDQLTSSQWSALKKCLRPLETLVSSTKNFSLKDMAKDICVAIRTHGTVSSDASKQQNSSSKCNTRAKHVEEKVKSMQNGVLSNDIDNSEQLIKLNNLILDDQDCKSKETQSSPKYNSLADADAKNSSSVSAYQRALAGLEDSSVPVRGHSLICLCKLVETGDKETFSQKDKVFEIFQKNIADEDSYIYLPAIHGLAALGDVDAKMVLPLLLSEFKSCRTDNWSYTLKVGEALLKLCRNLGELTASFRDQFLNTYLTGVRHQDPHIRASSLSNLGEVCKALKFSIGPMLQEILLCVISVLKSDPAVEVRRSAILVIALLLQGTGKDIFTILENELKDLYSLLRYVYNAEKDDILKLHAQLALEELNTIVKDSLQQKPPLIKEIRILDPF